MIRYTALPTDQVDAYRRGGPDAFGNAPERAVSDGQGNPCRHCLREVPAGARMLILAHKPFVGTHPYAEVGPIFLCADACQAGGGIEVPEVLTTSPDYLIKGYGPDDRIVYGTGAVIPAPDIAARAALLLAQPGVAYLHVRSARNNCYQLRIDPVA
ncbi:MAG: DUF1203 domain-containing protein [Pseudomonadota bacterium]